MQIIVAVRGLNGFPLKMIVDSVAIDKELWALSAAAGGCRMAILSSERAARKRPRLWLAKLRVRAPMMNLQELYRAYTTIAAKPGEPVPLAAFELSKEETEKLFSIFDEDYHISRFFHFRQAGGEKYFVDGESVTHVAIDPEISSIL